MAFTPKAAKELQAKSFFKFLLYGSSGAGKTTFGARFGKKPLILLTEKQALRSIQDANPEATVAMIKTQEDLREAIRYLWKAIKDGNCPYDSVVLDSLSDMQAKIIEEVRESQGREDEENMTQQDWGIVIDKTSSIARTFRDLDLHVCVIMMADEVTTDDEGRLVRPQVAGKKLPSQLLGYFSFAGYIYTQKLDKDNVAHRILTKAGSRFLVKGHPNWPRVCPPDASHLWKLINEPLKENALDFTGNLKTGAEVQSPDDDEKKGKKKNGDKDKGKEKEKAKDKGKGNDGADPDPDDGGKGDGE